MNALWHLSVNRAGIDASLERLSRLMAGGRYYLLANAALAAVYFFAAEFGFSMAPFHPSASPVWPPTGIAMAMLLLTGYRLWPGVFFGAFLANATTHDVSSTSLAAILAQALGIGVGNTLEAVAGVWLVNRFADGRKAFARTQTILRFVFFAAVLSTLISATVGVTNLCLTGLGRWQDWGRLWLTWWLGDAVSAVIVVPLLLIWTARPPRLLTVRQWIELSVLLLGVLATCGIIFGEFGGRHYPLAYLTIPFLLWAALRFGARVVITIVFIVSCVAIAGTLRGRGPFAVADPNTSLLLLQGFMCTITIGTLSLSAAASESKRVQADLEREKGRLADLAENAPVGLHWIGADGIVQWANKVEFELLGYAADEYIGHPIAEFCVDRKAVDEILERSRSAAGVRDYETQMRRKDGSIRHVLVSANGYWENGEFVQTRCFLRDITEQKQNELRVELFSNLGHRLSSAITEKKAADIIVAVADRLFGWDACTLDLFSPERGTLHTVLYMDTIDGQRTDCSAECVSTAAGERSRLTIAKGAQLILRQQPISLPADAIPFGDKKRASVSIMSVPIRQETNVIGLLSIHSYAANAYTEEDLQLLQALADHCGGAFERMRAEQESVRLNRELEKRVGDRTAQLEAANHELEAFCYSVSHDLRAPLRSIRGFSEALLEQNAEQLDVRGRDFLRRTCESSQQMDRLVEDLLKLSRISRSELRCQKVNLSRLANLIAEELRQAEPARSVELTIALDLWAHGDERLLRIALENLLRNAWKFTGKRTQARIEFRREDGADGAFFVRDNGAGFNMAYADKLFGVFQRLHSESEFPGTGVGLAIVQRIVKRHGGRAWAFAEADRGATFYFTLPSEGVS